MKLSIRRMNIFPKLLSTFLLALIPVYIVSLYMNESGRSSVREEISGSMKSRVHYYISAFDTEMSKLINFKRHYIFDDDVQSLSVVAPTMSDFDQRSAILRIQRQMVNIKDTSTFVNEARVDVPLIRKQISTSRIDSNMPEEEVSGIQRNLAQNAILFMWQGKLLLGETYPSAIHAKRKPVTSIVVELNADEIRRSLVEMTQTDGGGTILLGRKQGWSIASDESNPVLRQIPQIISSRWDQGQLTGQSTINIDDTSYLITFEYSSLTGAMLVNLVPEKLILGRLNHYRIGFYILTIISALTVVLFSYWIFGNIRNPLRRLVRAFRKVEEGDLTVKLTYTYEDEFGYLYKQFNDMIGKLKVLVHEVYEQSLRSKQAELKQLQSQINPHFLYNSFYYVYRMAEMNETENVVKFSRYLGDFLQFITRSGSEEVLLDKEYKHAIAYLEIQAMRFSNRITAVYEELPEACKNWEVPRLILQPIIENAFQHGLEDKMEDGLLVVKAYLEDRLVITVEDNGESLTDEQLANLAQSLAASEHIKETTGIINVHRRLVLKYGNRAGLAVERGSLGGLKVSVLIPGDKEQNGENS